MPKTSKTFEVKEVDVGKIIVTAIALSIVGSLLTTTIFSNYSAANYTGILAVVMPFVPILFGVGILYVVMREMGLGGKK